MSNIFLYAHGGSGNHGCEAIVRATTEILNGHNITLISSNPEEDRVYGIDTLCTIIKDREEKLNKCSLDFFRAYSSLKLKNDFIPIEKLYYKDAFSHIKKGDIALSIGGDNYCYADVYKYKMFHEMAKERGAKTVLWGCSVEPDVLKDSDIANDIKNYDLITARETISYEALKRVNPNTKLVSDPAFCLKKENIELPSGFTDGNTVGINISPMVLKNEAVSGITMSNYKNLIEYIIDNTNMSIALIPHVVWEDNDDRIPLMELYNEYANSGRVVMIQDCSCEKLKGYISHCRFFVGARTHATIAAYSSCVPTLVVGYSVKARGIARDLFGTEDGYVMPVQELKNYDSLKNAFEKIIDKESEINSVLNSKIPLYIEMAKNAELSLNNMK